MSTWEGHLLEKTELRIERIGLNGANLTDVAAVVADTLELPRTEVLVIDAHDDLLALDVLSPAVDPYRVAGREDDLLGALAQLPGVVVGDDTAVCSEGILGWIAADRADAVAALDRAREMAGGIDEIIARRALVLSTGPEVLTGQIEDTNKPWIARRLQTAGFTVTEGGALPDDTDAIARAVREAGEELGYGLVITTGGVGAEGKDGTVEALLMLDSGASTPVLFAVEQGHGRHAKRAVRIGVGRVGTALVVCLPGPHAEATLGADTLADALAGTREPAELGERIASALRNRLRTRSAS